MSDANRTTLTPYLAVSDAAAALAFYREAFEAEEVARMADAARRIAHAEIRIGGSALFVSDEYPEEGAFAPQNAGGTPVLLVLEVADADAAFARAIEVGAAIDRPFRNSPDGGLRTGKVRDPFGHRWMFVTRG